MVDLTTPPNLQNSDIVLNELFEEVQKWECTLSSRSTLGRGATSVQKRRLKRLKTEYAEGKIELEHVSRSIRSWIAHLKHGDTWRLRTKIFEEFVL